MFETLLEKHNASLEAQEDNIYVLRSTRKEEDFYCSFRVEKNYSESNIRHFYILPALTTLEEYRKTYDFEIFLDQAGRGCISGDIIDWPQLKPACAWAVEEIKKLREELRKKDNELHFIRVKE